MDLQVKSLHGGYITPRKELIQDLIESHLMYNAPLVPIWQTIWDLLLVGY